MKCQCYYCKRGILPPDEEADVKKSMDEIKAGKYRTVTIDELIKEIEEA